MYFPSFLIDALTISSKNEGGSLLPRNQISPARVNSNVRTYSGNTKSKILEKQFTNSKKKGRK